MIDKTKTILTIILVLFIIFAIIYSIINVVISLFKEPELISKDEIQLYRVDNNVVKNYSKYYYIEDCFENFIEAIKQEKYNELYSLYINKYSKLYTKDEIYAKFKQFSVNLEDYKLKKVYVALDEYILEYEQNGKIDYLLMELNAKKDSSYQFAFFK